MPTNVQRRFLSTKRILAITLLAAAATACGSDPKEKAESTTTTGSNSTTTKGDATPTFTGTLKVSAIPDQDPEKLLRTYGRFAT